VDDITKLKQKHYNRPNLTIGTLKSSSLGEGQQDFHLRIIGFEPVLYNSSLLERTSDLSFNIVKFMWRYSRSTFERGSSNYYFFDFFLNTFFKFKNFCVQFHVDITHSSMLEIIWVQSFTQIKNRGLLDFS
jgi:hypothetical protein